MNGKYAKFVWRFGGGSHMTFYMIDYRYVKENDQYRATRYASITDGKGHLAGSGAFPIVNMQEFKVLKTLPNEIRKVLANEKH